VAVGTLTVTPGKGQQMAYVFGFDHEHEGAPRELKAQLGGKGANLAEMTSVLKLPVPPGFTISTEACRFYLRTGAAPPELADGVGEQLSQLETRRGERLGDPDHPLLVSVRSGSEFSMPGMMDTVLNLGLNDDTVKGLARQTGDERFANDSYRRFIQMYGKVVLGLHGDDFERRFAGARELAGVDIDAEVPADVLSLVISQFKALIEQRTGEPFPQDPMDQLRGAIHAVFSSWNSPRAHTYRTREHIAHDLGTAVNVQSMVFGNRDDRSGTGVAFTRNPATGDVEPYGDFLVNAQGEDVVAGIRQTQPLSELGDAFPDLHDEFLDILQRLEEHYRDMMDVEFTIEQGELWILQTRVGKRTGAAALRIATALTQDERIRLTPREAVLRVRAEHLDQILHPQISGDHAAPIAIGLGASPGAAVGRVYFSADDAVTAYDRGEEVVLVRSETSPEDVHGMAISQGILTSRGGLASHAAVVARGWGKPAVCGAEAVEIHEDHLRVGSTVVREGETISLDGATGEVFAGEVDLTLGEVPPELEIVLGWADEIRAGKLAVWANADTPDDARRAREHGAEGIGLCRTEHQFLGERLPIVQRMILAEGEEEETAALAELGRVQRDDFAQLLEAMDGLPVTVRLLDPPLHEFLPDVGELQLKEVREGLDDTERALLAAARLWKEENPMLGTRGVRLGILKQGLYRMQVRSLCEAAAERRALGGEPRVEIMVPLIVNRAELELVRGWIEAEVAEANSRLDHPVSVKIGTMIETPRAALCAGDIAGVADFFSFGTNDLTQMTFGFSRDDVEGRLMNVYLELGLLGRNPFESLDAIAVGSLVRSAARDGRAANPQLELGVCGEHGGDPASIRVFYEAGLHYVSCSPFRVPIARLAAAQAVVEVDGGD
jgi:pyruvate, orthophosphate dikinase